MSERENKIAKGDIFVETRVDGREVEHRVTWVGTKKARLHAQLDYGWQTSTVWIDRLLDSPDWRRPVEALAPGMLPVSERVDVQQRLAGIREWWTTGRHSPEYTSAKSDIQFLLARLDALEEVAGAAGQYIDLINERGKAPDAPLILALARLREGEA